MTDDEFVSAEDVVAITAMTSMRINEVDLDGLVYERDPDPQEAP